MKAVQYDDYGGIDVLKVVDVERPAPGPQQVLVQVKAAGINPGEASIRKGVFAKQWPSTFPSGQGSDLAGVVAAVGADVHAVAVGDAVIGFTDNRASQAEFVVIEASNLTPKPSTMPWEVAGALFVAGTTAYAAVQAVGLRSGETVAVSAAAGGVGSIVVQMAAQIGAKVIGIASAANHQWLRDHGVIPIAYGDGMEERLREATNGQIDAFIDTSGAGYVELALRLGVQPARIDTIIDFAAAAKYGVQTAGNAQGSSAAVLAEVAKLVERGDVEIPIAGVYPLADVQAAYRELEQRHTRGKIVLVP